MKQLQSSHELICEQFTPRSCTPHCDLEQDKNLCTFIQYTSQFPDFNITLSRPFLCCPAVQPFYSIFLNRGASLLGTIRQVDAKISACLTRKEVLRPEENQNLGVLESAAKMDQIDAFFLRQFPCFHLDLQ